MNKYTPSNKIAINFKYVTTMHRQSYGPCITHDDIEIGDNVKCCGIDEPLAKVVHKDDQSLVLKVPGHRVWVGRGIYSYQPAETAVWILLPDNGSGKSFWALATSFPTKTKKS